MLDADVVVSEGEGLVEREFEDALGLRSERDLAPGFGVAHADDAHDLAAHGLERDPERLEDVGADPVLLAHESEQEVLGPDVAVPERSRLLLGQDDDLPRALGESLEQGHQHPIRAAPRQIGAGAGSAEHTRG